MEAPGPGLSPAGDWDTGTPPQAPTVECPGQGPHLATAVTCEAFSKPGEHLEGTTCSLRLGTGHRSHWANGGSCRGPCDWRKKRLAELFSSTASPGLTGGRAIAQNSRFFWQGTILRT